MVISCMAPGFSNRGKQNDISFHRLPIKDSTTLQKWLNNMKLKKPPNLKYSRLKYMYIYRVSQGKRMFLIKTKLCEYFNKNFIMYIKNSLNYAIMSAKLRKKTVFKYSNIAV